MDFDFVYSYRRIVTVSKPSRASASWLSALRTSFFVLSFLVAVGVAGCADAVEEATCEIICTELWTGTLCDDGSEVSSIECSDDEQTCLCTCDGETVNCEDLDN